MNESIKSEYFINNQIFTRHESTQQIAQKPPPRPHTPFPFDNMLKTSLLTYFITLKLHHNNYTTVTYYDLLTNKFNYTLISFTVI